MNPLVLCELRLLASADLDSRSILTVILAGDDRLGTVCAELLEAVRVSTGLLHPFIPRATARVATDLGIELSGDLTQSFSSWPALRGGDPVGVGEILFPRLDREAILGGR